MTIDHVGTAVPVETVPIQTLHRIIGLACLAPSVHNTQPWLWRLTPDGFELHADTTRQLLETDPDARELVLSCGAALHQAQVAATALGWQVEVDRSPAEGTSTLLARVRLHGPGGETSPRTLEALTERRTDRRRFTSWPVPDERLEQLVEVARSWGAHAVPLTDLALRFAAERLLARAADLQAADARVREEERRWVDHGARDGLPSAVLPHDPTAAGYPARFPAGSLEDVAAEVERGDGLLVIGGARDDRPSWLRAGEALSALWLAAGLSGLSVVPLSQAIEVDETRAGLRDRVLGGLGAPFILVRIGWQPISRSELPRTPRRPVADVLLD